MSGARGCLAVVALLAAAAGCPHKGNLARPYPPPAPAELQALLAARQAAVTSMNARARATSWLGGERVRATVLMLVTRAGKLRFEAEVSLQGTVATLATDGERFALLDVQKSELRRGPACPANVASLIRIPLAPAEVAAILLGDADLGTRDASEPGTVGWDGSRGADLWTVPVRGGTAELAFHGDAQARDLVGVTWRGPDGAVAWRTSYEDFATDHGARVPSTIRFAERSGSFDDGVEVKFKDRTLDVTPRPEDFVLSAPPGVRVREVGCAPAPPATP
jgi:hypothetical protein